MAWRQGVAAAPAIDGSSRGVLDDAYGARSGLVPADAPDGAAEGPADDGPARGNLTRYLRWQAWDWARQRGVWIGVLVLAVLLPAWANYDTAEAARAYQDRLAYVATAVAHGRRAWDVQTPVESLSENFLIWTTLLATCGSVLATFGIVARERERGLQRFLFAKPVGVGRYYAQKFAVAAVGQLAVALAGGLLASLAFHTALPVASAVGITAAAFAVLGALTFFFSTLTRFDGAAAVAALFASWIAFLVASPSESGWAHAARMAEWVLPPVPTIWSFAGVGASPPTSATVAVLWIACYAAAAFAAGLAVLRRRSITT